MYLSVSTEADFQKRLRWNSTRKVALIVLESIVLSQSLVMGPEFACTMMRPAQENVTITLEGDTAPALVIVNTSNVLIYDMAFVLPITPDSGDCTTVPENGPFTCPTVFIYRSYGIQLTKVEYTSGALDTHVGGVLNVCKEPSMRVSHGVHLLIVWHSADQGRGRGRELV